MEYQYVLLCHTVMKEMEFTQNRLLSKIVEPKPLGHKPKVALPAEPKAGRVDANVGKDKKAPAKALVAPAPAEKVKAGENEIRRRVTFPSMSASETFSTITVQISKWLARHPVGISTTKT